MHRYGLVLWLVRDRCAERTKLDLRLDFKHSVRGFFYNQHPPSFRHQKPSKEMKLALYFLFILQLSNVWGCLRPCEDEELGVGCCRKGACGCVQHLGFTDDCDVFPGVDSCDVCPASNCKTYVVIDKSETNIHLLWFSFISFHKLISTSLLFNNTKPFLQILSRWL